MRFGHATANGQSNQPSVKMPLSCTAKMSVHACSRFGCVYKEKEKKRSFYSSGPIYFPSRIPFILCTAAATHFQCTACGYRIAHRIWKETKQEPGTAGPGIMLGCCLVSFHFLWAILSTSTVLGQTKRRIFFLLLLNCSAWPCLGHA